MSVQTALLASAIHEAKPGFASGDDLDEGVFQIRMNNITRDGALDLTKKRRVRLEGKKSNDLLLEVGDVMFNATNSPDLVGKSAYIGSLSEPTTFSNHFIRLRANPEKLDGSYLARWLHTQFQSGKFKGLCRQWVNQATVSREALLGLEIPLLPLPQQRRIAAILDQADALRAKRREALAKLDSLTQSIFIEMFGDPVANPKGWPVVKLGSHTSKMGSGSTPTGGDAAYKESGISLIRSLNVHDGEFVYRNLAHIDEQQAAKLANVNVEANDVLLNITGASVARVCRAPVDVLPARVNQHVMIIRPKETINSAYLERLLLTPQMKLRLLQIGGAGATREAITKAQAEELPVICPPIELQREFERRCLLLTNIGASQSESLEALDDLFSSLQHRAFRGEL